MIYVTLESMRKHKKLDGIAETNYWCKTNSLYASLLNSR